MNTENNEPRKYNRYDENFKRSAVELPLQGGKSVATLATELGISSRNCRQRLAQAGVVSSMSRRDNCYDNAAMESF
jgi:transposase-like protein